MNLILAAASRYLAACVLSMVALDVANATWQTGARHTKMGCLRFDSYVSSFYTGPSERARGLTKECACESGVCGRSNNLYLMMNDIHNPQSNGNEHGDAR